MDFANRAGILFLITLLVACETPGPKQSDNRTPSLPKAVEVQRPLSPAYLRLLDEGQQQLSAGKIAVAVATFERAQRIHADNARVYLALSQAYSKAGDRLASVAMAERGLLYCKDADRCRALRKLAGG
jgi:tetratricopeptide (TPR) repeat protein